ncbi:glycosyltransferase family 2 protein [Deltaproteobacteria bacterium IMCC39524]|nr:glycosyltransferase family 2 protein [Deltaproteobacteria bacterium IMCC39524]
MNKVYILLLNWNNWPDTVECLESLLRIDYSDFRIVVCDNGSSDHSLEHIKDWADGKIDVLVLGELQRYSFPPVDKPVHFSELDRKAAETPDNESEESASLTLIQNGANLGFAGGNNVGLRYALGKEDCDFVWLLNNDTVVDPGALKALVGRLKDKKAAGMCGSTLLEYDRPERVQALGGAYYSRWFAYAWHLGRFRKRSERVDPSRIESWMDYVVGASMLVSKACLKEVGLMCEDYFLFFEEIDWAMRAKPLFSLAFAADSLVYHKVGASVGTSSHPGRKSIVCDFCNIRNRLFFTWKFFPWALPTVYVSLVGTLLSRALLGQWDRVRMILSLCLNFRSAKLPVPEA